jgi:hypothetical protein
LIELGGSHRPARVLRVIEVALRRSRYQEERQYQNAWAGRCCLGSSRLSCTSGLCHTPALPRSHGDLLGATQLVSLVGSCRGCAGLWLCQRVPWFPERVIARRGSKGQKPESTPRPSKGLACPGILYGLLRCREAETGCHDLPHACHGRLGSCSLSHRSALARYCGLGLGAGLCMGIHCNGRSKPGLVAASAAGLFSSLLL